MKLDYSRIILNIKALRVKHNLNQADLAVQLDMTARTYRKLENKPALFSLDVLQKMARIFDITIMELLCIEARQVVRGESIGSVNGTGTAYANDLAMIRSIYDKQIDFLISELELYRGRE